MQTPCLVLPCRYATSHPPTKIGQSTTSSSAVMIPLSTYTSTQTVRLFCATPFPQPQSNRTSYPSSLLAIPLIHNSLVYCATWIPRIHTSDTNDFASKTTASCFSFSLGTNLQEFAYPTFLHLTTSVHRFCTIIATLTHVATWALLRPQMQPLGDSTGRD